MLAAGARLYRLLTRLNARLWPRHLFYPPEWVVLGLNTVCNLRCRMCDVGTGHRGSNFSAHTAGDGVTSMPAERLARVVAQVSACFPRARLGYAVAEPALHPGLVESVAHARRLGLRTSLTSNGLRLPELAEPLAAAGLAELALSLDGPPATHNLIRGHGRSYQRALEGVTRLLASPAGRTEVSVYCTVTPWNQGQLRAFIDGLSGLPLRRVGFLHLNFTTPEVAARHTALWPAYPASESNLAGVDLDDLDLDRLAREVEAVRDARAPFPVTFSPELSGRDRLEVYYRQPDRLIGRRCNDASRTLMVRADGVAIPAHSRCYRVEAGSVDHRSLAALWNAPRLAAFRRDLSRAGGLMPACARCCSAL